MTEEQIEAKNNFIINKISASISKIKDGTLILVKGEAGAGENSSNVSSLVDDLLNSDDISFIKDNNFINIVGKQWSSIKRVQRN